MVILKLFASEDQTLLVERNALEHSGLASEGLDEGLHASTETKSYILGWSVDTFKLFSSNDGWEECSLCPVIFAFVLSIMLYNLT